MKKILLSILLLLLIAIGIGYTYWQSHKNAIVKDAIQSTLAQKTDSIYHIHYDSSSIDEIAGNAVFYNVVLQSDSLQQEQLKQEDSTVSHVLFNIHVKEVGILGVNMPGLLASQVVSARKIYLKEPSLEIIRTSDDQQASLTKADTLALYKQIIGKYKSIKADSIEIIDANVKMINKEGKEFFVLKKVNVDLNNLAIDSAHNYTNIISYFIKDLKASAEQLELSGKKPGTKIVLDDIIYNATKKDISVRRIRQYNATDSTAPVDIKKVELKGLNTSLLIIQHQLQANTLTCDGGVITLILKGKPAKKTDPVIELSDKFFDGAEVGSIHINNTTLIFKDPTIPGKPFELDSVKLYVYRKVNVAQKSTLSDLINNAYWKLSANGFSFNTADGVYKIKIGAFVVDNGDIAQATISGIHVIPLYTEAAYRKHITQQHDLYTFDFNNIVLTDINVRSFITDKKFEVKEMSVQPDIHIYNDRTLPPNDTAVNLGKYPHQSLFKIKTPFYIGLIHAVNGSFSYRERSSISGLVGNINFQNIDATIKNITNMPEHIAADTLCRLNATAALLGLANFSTQWDFPLNTKNGSFTISGQLDSMDASQLNPVIEPLGLMSVKQGQLDALSFRVKGNDLSTSTDIQLFYHDLHLEALEKVSNKSVLKKKELLTLVTNAVVRNNNEKRLVESKSMKRNIHRPFFNVVWTSIFLATKRTVIGKKDDIINPQ